MQEFGDFGPPLVAAHNHDRFAGVVVHCSDFVVRVGPARPCNHHLLALGTPHRPERQQPTDIDLVGIIEDFTRLSTMSAAFR